MRLVFRVIAAGVAFGAAGVLTVACDGTVVYDAPDPKQCASGNGCPMVTCTCNDGSFMIDSTCEVGKCKDASDVCADRCMPYEGVKTSVTTANDNVAIPRCDILYDRMLINRCKEGTELIASECASTDIQCSPEATKFWNCVLDVGILSCKRGALRVQNCETQTADQCEMKDATPPV